MTRPLVLMESPYRASSPEELEDNIKYAKRAMLDCIQRGETPLAGHLLYTQVLDDDVADERALGIEMHLSLMEHCDKVVFYRDRGVSPGMVDAVMLAVRLGKQTDVRFIGAEEL